MCRTLSRVVIVALMLSATGLARPQAQATQVSQTATVAPQLIQRFAEAPTPEARAALLAAHPELGELAGRDAISQFATGLSRANQLDEAERVYRALQWMGEQTGYVRTRSGALIGLGGLEDRRGNLSAAARLMEEALAMLEEANDVEGTIPPITNLTGVYRRLGNFERAGELSTRGAAFLEGLQAPTPQQIAQLSRLYNNIGLLHQSQSNLTRAREYLEKSLAIKKDDGGQGTRDLANGYSNLGSVYASLGDHALALTYYERAVALFERLGAASAVLTVSNNVAHAQIALGSTEAAEATLRRIEGALESAPDKSLLASTLFLRGLASRNRGDLAEAILLQQRSLDLRDTMGELGPLVESHVEISHLLLLSGRLVEAETAARRTIDLAAGARLLDVLASAQLYLGHTLESQGRLSEAQVEFEKAIVTTEQMRDLALAGERSRQTFMRERVGPYAALSALHSKADRGWDALRTVEQARARTLLDLVAFGRPSSAGLSDQLRARERALTNNLVDATVSLNQAMLRKPQNPAQIAALETARDRARLAHQAFNDDLYAANPGLQLSRGGTPTLVKSDLDALVPPGTVALTFMVNTDQVWLYAAVGSDRGAQVTTHRLQLAPAALMALAQRFSKQVSSRDLGFAATSRELYDALFSGVDAQLSSARRLIIVPDAALWSVPFQALTTPRDRYLIEERAVSYAPSLSALVALRARAAERPDRARTFVALGDPVTSAGSTSEVRSVAGGPLPEARREVQSLGRLYGDARSTVLVGADATEAALRTMASRASVLHIASHGVLDNRSPMFSHLRLTGAGTDAPERDGRLEAWELADLGLSADLVVLSACSTVGGIVGGGEGVMGLSWGLLAAGASTAVLSQWEVESTSTTALMLAFHQQRLKGDDSVEAAPSALRAAAMTLLKDPKYRHPFYWAGFIVMGS